MMTLKQLRAWLDTLPADFDDAEVCSDLHGNAYNAKRVVAARYKDGSGATIVVNPMGSHLSDYFYDVNDVVSTLGGDGKTYEQRRADLDKPK